MTRFDSVLDFPEIATPSDAPDTGRRKFYLKSDGRIYGKPPTGVEHLHSMPGVRWNQNTTYAPGELVEYGGRIWRCNVGNTNAPPAQTTGWWLPLTNLNVDDWLQSDPYFTSDNIPNVWETFWQSGTPNTTLSTTAGDFENGIRGLKIQFIAAGGLQRVYDKAEAIVHGGEVIEMEVRAKVTVAGSGTPAYLQADLWQSALAAPEPFGSGLNTLAASEGNQSLTTDWATYKFTAVAVPGKHRARFNLNVFGASGAASTVVIDKILIRKRKPISGGYPAFSQQVQLWGSNFNVGSTTHGQVGNTITFTSMGIDDEFQVDIGLQYLNNSSTTIGYFTIAIDGAAWNDNIYAMANGSTTNMWHNLAKVFHVKGLAAGTHTLNVRAWCNAAVNVSVEGPSATLGIRRMNAAGANTIVQAAGFRGTTSQSFTSAVLTTVDLSATPDHNVGGAFTITSNIITVLQAGIYEFNAGIQTTAMAAAGRAFLRVETWVGSAPAVGSGTTLAEQEFQGGNGLYVGLNISGQAQLSAGQQLRLYFYQASGGAIQNWGAAQPAKFNIRRVLAVQNADTGWMTLPGLAAGVTGSYCRIGGQVFVEMQGTNAGASGTVLAGPLPVGFRPGIQQIRPNVQSSGVMSGVYVDTAGNIKRDFGSGCWGGFSFPAMG